MVQKQLGIKPDRYNNSANNNSIVYGIDNNNGNRRDNPNRMENESNR